MGKEELEKGNRDYLDAVIDPKAISILLFTSATTSTSKAVKLTHYNIASNIMGAVQVIYMDQNDRFLSLLPLHHTFESTCGYLLPIYMGASIAYCEGLKHIVDNLKESESTAELETDSMRNPDFEMYNKVDEQPYVYNDGLNEDRIDQSKVFDQSEVDEIIGEIREITGILKDEFNANVEYSEFRFSDGTGGFSFKWAHGRNQGGRFGLSLRSDGNHKLEAISRYGDKIFGSEDIKSNNTSVQNVETWKNLNTEMLISIWTQLRPMVIKNEAAAEAALSAEAKAQSDYYGAKADTGRIGYGLSSQPRMRNENLNDPVLMKMRAQQDQYDKELEKSIEPKVDFDEVLDLRGEKIDLELRIKNLYREMENDPDIEAEGGAVADQYGDELNKLETRLYKVMKQINNYDMNENKLTESLNPEVSKALDRFIKAMAKRYSYSEKDAVFAIQAALKQRDFKDEEKSSKFKKSGEEAGFDMRG